MPKSGGRREQTDLADAANLPQEGYQKTTKTPHPSAGQHEGPTLTCIESDAEKLHPAGHDVPCCNSAEVSTQSRNEKKHALRMLEHSRL